MAGSSLFALIDDIATLLDDVALMSKVAAKKTAGVLGDDLALNAQQVAGVSADRELPVVWAVAKGSMRNKAILVPAALLISSFAPWLVLPLLMLGGAFLCYEGFEKLAHHYQQDPDQADAHRAALATALANPALDVLAFERDKIRGAVRTDFILSAEIIVISLGTVADKAFSVQLGVLVGIALIMTVGVYGVVAAIVKLDDAGLWLSQRSSANMAAGAQRALGALLLRAAPLLMKFLSGRGRWPCSWWVVAFWCTAGRRCTTGWNSSRCPWPLCRASACCWPLSRLPCWMPWPVWPPVHWCCSWSPWPGAPKSREARPDAFPAGATRRALCRIRPAPQSRRAAARRPQPR
jgi:predicted DNA repair protein MutK